MTANDVAYFLGLEQQPEGGVFKDLFRAEAPDCGSGAMTRIYYKLPVGQPSRWRVIDADEVWSSHAGAPLTLSISHDGKTVEQYRLGTNFAGGVQAQAVVPKNAWTRAESHGGRPLVGGTVAPAFLYEGFCMAPPDWMPGDPAP